MASLPQCVGEMPRFLGEMPYALFFNQFFFALIFLPIIVAVHTIHFVTILARHILDPVVNK